jgi:hypothetical protein
VFFSLIYVVTGRMLALLLLRRRGQASKDVELVLLRHEVAVLRRQTPGRDSNPLTGWSCAQLLTKRAPPPDARLALPSSSAGDNRRSSEATNGSPNRQRLRLPITDTRATAPVGPCSRQCAPATHSHQRSGLPDLAAVSALLLMCERLTVRRRSGQQVGERSSDLGIAEGEAGIEESLGCCAAAGQGERGIGA